MPASTARRQPCRDRGPGDRRYLPPAGTAGTPPEPRPPVRKTYVRLLTEYGIVAVVVWFALFFLVLVSAWAAIRYGWDPAPLVARLGLDPRGLVATTGSWVLAYLFTKLTTPLRAVVTLALTPLAARAYERVTGRKAGGAASREQVEA